MLGKRGQGRPRIGMLNILFRKKYMEQLNGGPKIVWYHIIMEKFDTMQGPAMRQNTRRRRVSVKKDYILYYTLSNHTEFVFSLAGQW